jgi:hypothetical protein
VCCAFLFVFFGLTNSARLESNRGVVIAVQTLTIVLSVVSNLASVGSKISIEKGPI